MISFDFSVEDARFHAQSRISRYLHITPKLLCQMGLQLETGEVKHKKGRVEWQVDTVFFFF